MYLATVIRHISELFRKKKSPDSKLDKEYGRRE